MKQASPYNTEIATRSFTVAVLAALLAACGGGSGGSDAAPKSPTSIVSDETGNTKDNTKTPENIKEDSKPTDKAGREGTDDTPIKKVHNGEAVEPVVAPDSAPFDPIKDSPRSVDTELSQNELAAFNRLNTRRISCGFGGLRPDSQLKAAADNHANYLLYMLQYSSQGFQGHSETEVDGFSGIKNPYYSGKEVTTRVNTSGKIGLKATAVSYPYSSLSEDLSYLKYNDAYFEQEGDKKIALRSINGLLAAPYHMASLLNPRFTDIGISYGRVPLKAPLDLNNGKKVSGQGSVLEMVLAAPSSATVRSTTEVISYPCNGTKNTQYELRHEAPNPFGSEGRNLKRQPIGQPIFILADGKLDVTDYKMTDAANSEIALKALTSDNDIHKLLPPTQVILMPLTALKPNQAYRVSYSASVDNGLPQNHVITFSTKAAQ